METNQENQKEQNNIDLDFIDFDTDDYNGYVLYHEQLRNSIQKRYYDSDID